MQKMKMVFLHAALLFCLPRAYGNDTLRTVQPPLDATVLGQHGEVGVYRDLLTDHDTFHIGEMMYAPSSLFETWHDERFNFGFAGQSFWLRLDLTDTADRKLILEMDNPYLSRVNFYQVLAGEVLDTQSVGSDLPFDGRRHWNLRDTVRLSAGDTIQCYINIPYNRSQTEFHIFLSDAQYRAKSDRAERMLLIVFFCLVFVYLLMLGLAINLTRFRYYWFYFAYVLLASGFIFTDIGLGYQTFWPRWPYVQQVSLPILANAYLIAGAQFVMAHFHTRRHYPLQHKVMRAVVWVAAAMIPVTLVLPALPIFWSHLFSYFHSVLYIVTVLLFFWIAGTAFFRNDRTLPGWLLFGFLVHGIHVIYSSLENFGLVPPISLQHMLIRHGIVIVFHTPLVLMVGLLVEMGVVLLIGLKRFRNMLTESQRMSRELAEQRKKNLNALALGMETEQRRIAQELHDGLGGGLAAAKFKLEKILSENPTSAPELNSLVGDLSSLHQELREVAHNLMPKHLHKQGLLAATELLVQRMQVADPNLQISFFCNADLDQLNELATVYLYRILQELLSNLYKHSGANEAWLQILKDETHLRITLEDNGRGFDSTAVQRQASGIGLSNIRYRVEDALGGKLHIEAAPGNGSLFSMEIPWKNLK
ncbi:MAG: hypothetical protein IT258_04250 [Saprospiraceae bacterium]|nr:hypothetical protein [Saprospiraceae bacterium]